MARPFFRKMTSNYDTRCSDCGEPIKEGVTMYWNPNKRAKIKRTCEPCGVQREENDELRREYIDIVK
jgi:hypothetical protein